MTVFVEEIEHFGHDQGLGHTPGGTLGKYGPLLAECGVGSEDHNRECSRGRVGSQRLQNVMPGAIGKVQIEKNHLWLVSFRQFNTESAERGMNEPPGRPQLQDVLDNEDVGLIVFYVEQRVRARQRPEFSPRVAALPTVETARS
jgi:hypothetical protein